MNWRSGRRRAVGPAISTSASSASRPGTPSAAGEALQMLPAKVPAFWIWRPPTSRRGLLQAVEQGRQVGLQKLAPGRGGAQPPARRAGRDAAQNVDAADIEHVLVDRPADPRRVEVGAAGQHRVRLASGQCAQRLFKAAWTKVDTHIVRVRTMPMRSAASQTGARTSRSASSSVATKHAADLEVRAPITQTILERSSRSWRCSWLLSGFRVSRDTAGPLTSSLVIRRWPSVVRLSSVRRASPGCGRESTR